MERSEQLQEIAERIATAEGLELVDLEYRREGAGWVVRLFIDKPGGVTLENCQEVSHQVGAQVEVEDLIPHQYRLEVSSPGLDRVIKKEADFRRFAGKEVQITTDRPIDGQRKFQGRLEGMQEGHVLLTTDAGETCRLPLERIARARLTPEF